MQTLLIDFKEYSIIYENKREKLWNIVGSIGGELSGGEGLGYADETGYNSITKVKDLWISTQNKLDFELRNEGLKTGQEASARSLDALKQWFISSKENWNKTLGKIPAVKAKISEFPFKSL